MGAMYAALFFRLTYINFYLQYLPIGAFTLQILAQNNQLLLFKRNNLTVTIASSLISFVVPVDVKDHERRTPVTI